MTTVTANKVSYRKELKQKTAKPMLWIAIVSMVMFFGATCSAMVVKMAEADWGSIELPAHFGYSTAIIVVSSVLFHVGYIGAKRDRQGQLRIMLLITLVLGLSFGVSQFLGWQQMISEGIYPTGPTSTPNAQYVFVLTLFHLLHIFGGWISLIVVNVKAQQGKYNPKNLLGLQLSTTYWHFLGVLWILLFILLKNYS